MDRKAVLNRELAGFSKKAKRRFADARVILFGSRARGDSLLESDYDILVISSKFEGMHFLRRMEALFPLWGGKLRADIFGFTPQEISRRRNELGIVGTALREGIEVA